MLDLAVGADYERSPGDPHYFLPVHIFFLDDAVGFGNFLIGVGQKRKGKVEFVPKFFLGFRCVRGNAEEDHTSFLNLLIGVAEGAGLDGASRSVGARIEIEHDHFAAQGFERDFLVVLVVQRKLGSLIIDVDIHGNLISREIKVEDRIHKLGVGRAEAGTSYLQEVLIPQNWDIRHCCSSLVGCDRAGKSGSGGSTSHRSAEKSATGKQKTEER